ncbi:MAG: class B sortase [Clostridia bacterium]|nr:class B sortase [Clostridia bacterium]
MARKIARLIDGLLSLIAGLLAAALLLYSGYVLYDNFNTNRNAFSSWDLLQYKPSMDVAEDPGFQELRALNPDVIGWLTLYDTHIDYPLLQGEDNLEYVSKDVYCNFSLSGCIYLAAESSANLGDEYSLIYGHHMENGAMFGDIDQFADADYFSSHSRGLIQTPEGSFELRVFACVRTDAYESLVYNPVGRDYAAMADFIRANAVAYDPAGAAVEGRLVALSTCADMDTNGRLVLFAKAVPWESPLEAEAADEADEAAVRRRAVGHGGQGATWALLNLVCVLLTVYTLLPLGSLRVKYRQLGYSRRTATRLAADPAQGAVVRDLRRFVRRMRAGIALELAIAVASALAFYFTENIRRAMVISDRWTPWMIGGFALALLIDFICFRYRGKRPSEE